MHKDLQKPQAYQWICRGFLQSLYAQEIGADRVKNRSIYVEARSAKEAIYEGMVLGCSI